MRKRILVLLTTVALAVSSMPVGVCADTDINSEITTDTVVDNEVNNEDISVEEADEELVGTGDYYYYQMDYGSEWCYLTSWAMFYSNLFDRRIDPNEIFSANGNQVVCNLSRIASKYGCTSHYLDMRSYSTSQKDSKVKELLASHPEGVLVDINKPAGGLHCVLARRVSNDTVYFYDPGIYNGTNKTVNQLFGVENGWGDLSYVYWATSNTPIHQDPVDATPHISGQSIPNDYLKIGTAFNVTGVVTCDAPISSVQVYVLDNGGKAVTGKTVQPNSYSYDLNKVDNDVKFSKLSVGTYEYKITVVVDGKEYVLLSKLFDVTDGTSGDCSKTTDDHVKWKVVKGENNKLKLIISGTGRICDSYYDNTLFGRIHKELCGLSGYENELISEIEIDEGVTGIGDYAFDCLWGNYTNEIERVSLPNSLLEIGCDAFGFCRNLQEINIPKNVNYIGTMAFGDCSSLEEITIPKGITSIENYTFEDCSSLRKVTIPQSVTYFGSGAFEGCSSLQEITIPQGVTHIGRGAFSGCSNIQKITIPKGVTAIGEGTFSGCSSLQEISIPTSVTSIKESAFSDCSSLQKLTIPDGVTSIEEFTFWGCSSIQEIKIPTSVVFIGDCAFHECKRLQYLNIPKGVTHIGHDAFYGCNDIERISLPVGISVIEYDTFRECESLKEIEIPEGVTSIDDYAFCGCKSLQKITIPTSVNYIGIGAFEGCSSLKEITIPQNITKIRWVSFSGCSNLRKITLPEGVTTIEDCAFEKCSNLQEVSIPKNVTDIGAGAFSGCSSLQELIIPEGVKEIVTNTWYGCEKLQKIHLPHSMEKLKLGMTRDPISWWVQDTEFARDTSLTDIYYNGSKEEWEKIVKPTDDKFIDESKITIHFLKLEEPTATPVPTATPKPTATQAVTKITGQICGTGLSLKGKIGANILLGFTDVKVAEAADPSIIINVDGKETVLKLSGQEHYTSGKKEIYEIHTFVPAKLINEKIELKLIDKNGKNIGLRYGKKNLSSFVFSIGEITDGYLANAEVYGEKTIDLVTAMKNYCGYIQLMNGYKTDTVNITDDLADVTAKNLKPYASVYDKNSKIAKYTGVGLALQSDTTMQIYFKLMDNVDAYTFTVDGEAVTPESLGNNQYCIELKSIPAGKLSTTSEIVISKGSDTFTIKASALSWAESVLSNSKAQKQSATNMAKMLYRYSQKADIYFAKK